MKENIKTLIEAEIIKQTDENLRALLKRSLRAIKGLEFAVMSANCPDHECKKGCKCCDCDNLTKCTCAKKIIEEIL